MNIISPPTEWRKIRMLYEKLQDPFVMMPMQSVIKHLDEGFSEVETNFFMRMGRDGVARKFWDVPTELLHEEKGLFVGNIFILAQVAIVQTVAIFGKLRTLCENSDRFPAKKDAILEFKSEVSICGNFRKITIIDSVANYFKHQYEWSDDWSGEDEQSVRTQIKTIRFVKSLGMTPSQDLTENMGVAINKLGISNDLIEISDILISWREELARQLLTDPKIANSI